MIMTTMTMSLSRKKDVIVIQSIINKLKSKVTTTIVDTITFAKYRNNTVERNNNNFNIKVEKRSCSCILFVDNGMKIEAKIIHNGRGKFKILEDNCRGKHINKIVDASDVIRCKVEPANHIYGFTQY
jgi:hypothetical protein